MKKMLMQLTFLVAATLLTVTNGALAQPGVCNGNIKVSWTGFTNPPAPTTILTLTCSLKVQNTGSGSIAWRPTGISNASGSTTWNESYNHNITEIRYVNQFGTGIIDTYEPSPWIVPSGVTGWCYEFSWDGTCPIEIKVRPVTCS